MRPDSRVLCMNHTYRTARTHGATPIPFFWEFVMHADRMLIAFRADHSLASSFAQFFSPFLLFYWLKHHLDLNTLRRKVLHLCTKYLKKSN